MKVERDLLGRRRESAEVGRGQEKVIGVIMIRTHYVYIDENAIMKRITMYN